MNINTPEFLRTHPNPFVRFMENQRTSILIKRIKVNLKPKMKVADIGCGDGSISHSIFTAIPNIEIIGIDHETKLLKEAFDRNKKYAFKVISADVRSIPLASKTFDMIYCGCILSHVENPQEVVREFSRLLKPNGKIVLQIPNDDIILSCKKLASLFRLNFLFPDINIAGLAADHISYFNLKKIQDLFRGRFNIIKTTYSPVYFYIYIEANKKAD